MLFFCSFVFILSITKASEAGIVILCQSQLASGEVEEDEDKDTFEFDRGYGKWTKKTGLLDTEMIDVDDSWHDILPDGFSLKVRPCFVLNSGILPFF